MEWAELVLDYIRALIWPVVVLAIVLVFRERLRDLFENITELGGGGVSVKFEREAKEIISASSGGTTVITFPDDDDDEDGEWTEVTTDGKSKAPPAKVETVTVTFDGFQDVNKVLDAWRDGKAVRVVADSMENEDALAVVAYFAGFSQSGKAEIVSDPGPNVWKRFELRPTSNKRYRLVDPMDP